MDMHINVGVYHNKIYAYNIQREFFYALVPFFLRLRDYTLLAINCESRISGAVDVPSPLSPTTKPSLSVCSFFIIFVGGNVIQANRIRWGPGRKFQFMVSASMPVFDQRNLTVSSEKPSSSTQKQQQPNAQTKEKQVLQLLSFMLCFLFAMLFYAQ